MPIETSEVDEFKRYLTEMLERASKTVSTESLRAQMWARFLPEAISFWTLSGVLERIAEQIKPKDDSDDSPGEDDSDDSSGEIDG